MATAMLSANLETRAYLRLPEVSATMNVSKYTIMNWVKRGTFPPPARHGRLLLWPTALVREHVQRHLDERKEEPQTSCG